jgi:hypothetical protein
LLGRICWRLRRPTCVNTGKRASESDLSPDTESDLLAYSVPLGSDLKKDLRWVRHTRADAKGPVSNGLTDKSFGFLGG